LLQAFEQENVTYTYDSLDQLTSAQTANSAPAADPNYPTCEISNSANTTISESCVILSNVKAGGNITIENGAVMILGNDVTLGIDLVQYYIEEKR
jgi:hypothetical protein